MAVGFALVRLHLLKTGDSKTLSVLSVYAICPCAFISATQVDLTPDVLQGFLFAVICAIVLQVGQIVLTKVLAKPLHLSPIERAASIYSNCGNLIIPLVGFILGDEWVVYSLAYMSVQTILIWTHGKSLISENHHIDVRAVLFNINLLAVAAGIVLMVLGIKLVEPFGTFTYDMGQMIGPAAMLATGMIIGGMDLRQNRSQQARLARCVHQASVDPRHRDACAQVQRHRRFGGQRPVDPAHYASCHHHPISLNNRADGADLREGRTVRQRHQCNHHVWLHPNDAYLGGSVYGLELKSATETTYLQRAAPFRFREIRRLPQNRRDPHQIPSPRKITLRNAKINRENACSSRNVTS